jgi:hypothetical protein
MRNRLIALAALVLLAVTGTAIAQTTPPPAAGQQAPPVAQAPRPPASPLGSAAAQVAGQWFEPQPGAPARYRDGKWITIDYSRPILKGRSGVFGKGPDYGKGVNGGAPVWRAGANQTTRLKSEVPLVLGGKTLAAGEYSLFVDLKEGAWTLIVSTQPYQQKYDPTNKTDTWGSYNYDQKFDVVRVPMKVAEHGLSVEQFTIGFVNMTQQGGTISLSWDKTVATVDFTIGK